MTVPFPALVSTIKGGGVKLVLWDSTVKYHRTKNLSSSMVFRVDHVYSGINIV
jgi:hypothetical protein